MKRRGAFTLIELLVVTAILAAVIVVLGGTIAGGVRVWEQARTFNRDEAAADFAAARVRLDTGALVPFAQIGFAGRPDGFVLPVLVDAKDEQGAAVRRIGRVEYSFDAGRGVLLRRAAPHGEPAGEDERTEAVQSGLAGLELSYLAPAGDRAGNWVREYASPTNYPALIRCAFLFSAEGAPLVRTLRVPMGRGEL